MRSLVIALIALSPLAALAESFPQGNQSKAILATQNPGINLGWQADAN